MRLLEDETVWAGLLAGAQYEPEGGDIDPGDGGPLRRLPVEGATAQSSMGKCAEW